MPHPASARRPRPGGVLLPLLAGACLLYFVGLGVFAVLHYPGGRRPEAAAVFGDFHAWLGLGPSRASAAPTPRPVPATPAPLLPSPPTVAAARPVVVPLPADPLDAVAATIRRVAREAPSLRDLPRGPVFDAQRVGALASLSEARDVLNTVLDRDESDDRANRLWDRLQRLWIALHKL
ncbi:MAG: hypothetical protein ACC662_00190 [Planctomycetota bacterium]